eukprot:g1579.t1
MRTFSLRYGQGIIEPESIPGCKNKERLDANSSLAADPNDTIVDILGVDDGNDGNDDGGLINACRDTDQQSVDEMRAQRRVFRLATQLPVTKTPNRHASGGANLLPIERQVAVNKTPSPLRNRLSTSTATTPTTTKSKPKKTVSSAAPTPSQTSGMSPTRSRANSTNLADSPSQHIGSKKKTKKLTVVLDLDETLVHSTFHGPAGNMYRQTERRKKNVTSNRVQSFRLRLEDGDEVTVNKRPHLKEFLMAMRDEFECHVFTAALPCYARPVLNMIDPKNVIFKKRMYRDSCTPSGMGTFAKDLTRHYKDLSRVVLVDNNPISLMKQPSNGLLVPSFFDDPKDDVLPTVLDFLRQLQPQPDVRPVIRGLQPN